MKRAYPAVGILGSGFGLYGYLPALISQGFPVVLLDRYLKSLNDRKELFQYKSEVEYCVDETELISKVEILVVARRPKDQVKLVETLLTNDKKFLLEKPLAPTLRSHKNLLQVLKKHRKPFSVGYLFGFTHWGQEIRKHVFQKDELNVIIDWDFVPNSESWKEEVTSGGGILNYYAIHIVPFLCDLGDLNSITYSLPNIRNGGVSQTFNASYSHCTLNLRVNISAKPNPRFNVSLDSRGNVLFRYEAHTPFGSKHLPGHIDNRVEFLVLYLKQILDDFHFSEEILHKEEMVLSWREWTSQQ